jgi:SET domain-containing protein
MSSFSPNGFSQVRKTKIRNPPKEIIGSGVEKENINPDLPKVQKKQKKKDNIVEKTRESQRLVQLQNKNHKFTQDQQNILSGVDSGVAEYKAGKILKRGVFALQNFKKGDFVVEYAGDFLSTAQEFESRLIGHDAADRRGSYIFWFKHQGSMRWYVEH